MSKELWVNDGMVKSLTYGPIGMSSTLQNEITQLMHALAMRSGVVTLAELGYFHMNTVTFVEDHVEVKLYFHPALATTQMPQHNGKIKYIPNDHLNIFKDYMFVGNLEDNVSYDTVTVPKYRIQNDSLGRAALSIRNTKKMEGDEEVLVLNCNLSLVIAAINGVSLTDPNFEISYETIASIKKSKKSSDDEDTDGNTAAAIVATVGTRREFPVTVKVKFTEPATGYNPDDAIPYLMSKLSDQQAARDNKKKLAKKVSSEAAAISKKQHDKQYKNYLKYR